MRRPPALRLGDRNAVRPLRAVSVWSAIATVPVFAWEASLAIYLIAKGFKPSPITNGITADTTPAAHREFAA